MHGQKNIRFTGNIATSWGLMSCSLAKLSKPAASISRQFFNIKIRDYCETFKNYEMSHSKW